MGKLYWARSRNTFHSFPTAADRDAWVRTGPRRERREAAQAPRLPPVPAQALPRVTPHVHYAQLGNVFFRFKSREARDAWVAAGPKAGEARAAATYLQVPNRLRFGKPDLEHLFTLVDGPEDD